MSDMTKDALIMAGAFAIAAIVVLVVALVATATGGYPIKECNDVCKGQRLVECGRDRVICAPLTAPVEK